MGSIRVIGGCLAISVFTITALAQETSTTATTETTTESVLKGLERSPSSAGAQSVDDVITNARLRAESGSKSRFSLASQLSYMGGSVDKPLAEDRPNISATTGSTNKALIGGQASVKYTIKGQHSLLAGVGLRWIAPLSMKSPRNYDGERFDADNPYITYQYISKWRGIQSVLQVQSGFYTNSNLVRQGYVSNLVVQMQNMYQVPDTRLTLGLAWMVMGAYYNKSGPLGDPSDTENYIADVRSNQSDYAFNIDPVLEYQFNDRYNFRTVTNLWNYEHLRSEARATTFKFDKVYQSVGLGIAVTRDIFLYPNVQFLPDDIRIDRTNVALTSFINIF